MNKWETCPQCGKELTFTEVKSENYNGYDTIVRYKDVGWCEPCWEEQTNQKYSTSVEIYNTNQLDKQTKEAQIE
tara:strand:- start:119 stop:340 length:222 start_codon:yes stop_codon:yes gene_type:complete